MSHPEIVARAFEAFAADVARQPTITLRGGNELDEYKALSAHDPALDAVSDAYLERYPWGIGYLDPDSSRHYLPHLIEYALRHAKRGNSVADALLNSLRPPDREPPRLASLSEDQEAMVTQKRLQHTRLIPDPFMIRLRPHVKCLHALGAALLLYSIGAWADTFTPKEIAAYPFVASAERASLIRTRYKDLRPAMEVAEVRSILGEPDEIRPWHDPNMRSTKIAGHTYWYVLRRLVPDGSDSERQEALVRIRFGLDGKVASIVQWGVTGE